MHPETIESRVKDSRHAIGTRVKRCPTSHELSTVIHSDLGITGPLTAHPLWINAALEVDRRWMNPEQLHNLGRPSRVRVRTCGTLWTTVQRPSPTLTSVDAGFSPIHSTYYQYQLLHMHLSGESEHHQ